MSEARITDDLTILPDERASLFSPPLMGSLLLIALTLLEPLWNWLPVIATETYGEPSFLREALKQKIPLVFILLSGAFLIFTWKHVWEDSYSGRAVRVLVGTSALCLGWAFSAYPYNYIAGQAHLLDRLIIALLSIAVCWRPAFLGPFLIACLLSIFQFDQPALRYSWTDKMPLIQMLYLATIFQCIRLAKKSIGDSALLFSLLVMWAGFYFVTGLAKAKIGWLWINPPGNLVIGAYLQNGWLSNWDWAFVSQLAHSANSFGWLLKLIVSILELSALLIFFHRRLAMVIFAGAILLHLGIFALTGILFWKWMAMDLAFLSILRFSLRDENRELFGMRAGIIGAVACVSFVLLSPSVIWLGWFDSPFLHTFEFVATDDEGRQWTIPPEQFSPFELPFAQGRFHFLAETPQLTNCFGAVSSREVFDATTQLVAQDSISLEKLTELKNSYGQIGLDELRKDELEKFFGIYFEAYHRGELSPRSWYQPPPHIWTTQSVYTSLPPLIDGLHISKISVILREFVMRGTDYEKVHQKLVFQTEIPVSPTKL